jgi:acetoacetate decarboxylase
MQLLFRADPEKVKEFIPPPLDLGPEPGLGIVWFVEWVSVSESNPDLAFLNPERSVYKECIIMVQCSFKGEPGYLVPYIWVDNDFTLMRGFIQGFPKRLARIYFTKLHELNPKIGGKRAGAKVKGICEAHGERLVEGSLVFKGHADPSELPRVRFYLMRHFPSIEDSSKTVAHEIASSVGEINVADVWKGEAKITFFPSELEELAVLAPVEVLGGFYHGTGLTIHGGKVLHRY